MEELYGFLLWVLLVFLLYGYLGRLLQLPDNDDNWHEL
jgi:hypothetical protein